jgi:hypothetical protein
MESAIFEELQQIMTRQGPDVAIDRLVAMLRERKEYDKLFYALLMKKRHELGVYPVPTDPAQFLAEAVQKPYEEAIRAAGRLVGRLYLEEKDIPRAWMYFRMLGEPEPVAGALEQYRLKEDEECQPLIEIAFHQGVHPRKGFEWILERYGICSAITQVSGQEFGQLEVRQYCVKGLVRALYEQLRARLVEDISRREDTPAQQTIRELMAGRDWLFEDEFSHIDVSHLGSIVQMSVTLSPCPELGMARELCEYGRRQKPRFQYPGDPPFENQYHDYAVYLAIIAGDQVEEGLGHFRAKVVNNDLSKIGTYPAAVLVNLYLRLDRLPEALAIARQYLAATDGSSPACPSIAELCKEAKDFQTLAEVAREQGDPVHFIAGLLAAKQEGMSGSGVTASRVASASG